MNTETLLREALSSGAGALRVPEDPWPGFARRERTHRRNRRIRRSVAAAVLAVLAGAQAGLVPLPVGMPGIAVAGHATALTNSPTRGSLAGDLAWQAGMRQQIKDVTDPGELWRVTDRSKIKFLYAADLPDRRLALALVSLRFGFLTDQALVWYQGAPGAAPAQMSEGSRVDGGTTVVTYLEGSSDHPGVLVVVAPQGSTVSVSSGFRYTAVGRVEHAPPIVSAPGSGLAEVILPTAPADPGTTVTVTSGGRTLYSGPGFGGWAGSGEPPHFSDAAIDRALRGHRLDRATFQEWTAAALRDSRLQPDGTTLGLRWTGTVHGQPAALLTLQPAGGGVLVYAMHGSVALYRQDLRLLLPAAGADTRPIAWRMRAEGRDDRTDQVVVVAPGAQRATLSPATPVTLDSSGFGTATLAPDAAASVTAYAAEGSASVSTPVPPFETDSGGLPGDTPKTRIVD